MSREIKFRAWDNKGKIMLDWLLLRQTAANREFSLMYSVFTGPKDAIDEGFVLMQYTGFKDNAAKEIYEGDIIKSFHFTDHDEENHYLHHRVEWDAEWGLWKAVSLNNIKFDMFTNGNCQLSYFTRQLKEFEVIGNVYENPEFNKLKK